MITITPFYAGIIGLLLVALSFWVIGVRRQELVSVGDGGSKLVGKRMRVHANCAEYAPMGLILMALAEWQGAPGVAIHILGLMLVIGRLSHAIGFGRTPQIVPLRQIGMVLTFLMLIGASIANIAHAMM